MLITAMPLRRLPRDPEPTPEGDERLFHVCAPIDASIVIYQALARTDWKQSFDVLELDWEQLALLNCIGLWDAINAHCGTFIDIREEAEIAPENIEGLLTCIARAKEAASGKFPHSLPSWEHIRPEALPAIQSLLPEVLALLERLHELAAVAQSRGVQVLFLF